MPHTGSTMRLANLRGTLSLAVHDRFRAATEAASGASGSGPAALATLASHMDGEDVDALSRLLGISHSAAVRLTDRLVHAGYVEGLDQAIPSIPVHPSIMDDWVVPRRPLFGCLFH
jgi:hypothetical protein